MAEVSDHVVQQNLANSQGNISAMDENYNALKALAKTAVLEFDDMKLKCREYFIKYKAEQERYLRAKTDLEQLKNISSVALDEYENLQHKYHVEQECRDKAVDIASQVVGQNKQLKRQSQMIMTHFAGLNGDGGLDLSALQDIEKSSSESDSGSDSAIIFLQDEIKELKEKVETFKTDLGSTRRELEIAQEGFSQEKKAHVVTRKKLLSSEKKLKQLNRVSVMAFEEFSDLQTKLVVETQCRAEAEKLAAEAIRADEDVEKKNLILQETASHDERLAKAFEEITKLNKELEEARNEKEEKIKELTEEVLVSKDEEYMKGMKEKLDLANEEIENLENQVTEAQNKAKEAEERAKMLAKKFDDFKRSSLPPPPPPPPASAPPPPPPPPPITVVKKLRSIMGKKKKGGSLKRQQKQEDPLAVAMKEMMDRINTGKVQLKPVKTTQHERNSSGSEEGAPGMSELGNLLTTMKRTSSIEDLLEGKSPTKTDDTCEWTSIKLRKRSDQGVKKQFSDDFPQGELPFKTSPLRKPRSHSVNDILDERPEVNDEATSELRKILRKQKTIAEREMEAKKTNAKDKENL